MRNALHEQLLKAGLIDEKRLRDLEREQQRPKTASAQRPPKKQHAAPANPQKARPPARPLPVQAPLKAAETQAERRALERELVQLIKAGRLPHNDGDEVYNFIDNKKIGRIYVTPTTQAALVNGDYAVVRLRSRYAIVTAATANLIAQRAPEFVIPSTPPASAEPEDPAYTDYPVPDDLRW